VQAPRGDVMQKARERTLTAPLPFYVCGKSFCCHYGRYRNVYCANALQHRGLPSNEL